MTTNKNESQSGAPQDPNHPEAILRQIGVEDIQDGVSFVRDSGAPGGGGLIVRGARSGGSPFLNLLTRGFVITVALFVVVVAVGLWFGGRALLGGGESPATEDGIFRCSPTRRLAGGPVAPVVGQLVRVAGRLESLPRDQESLAAVGGETYTVEDDRVDVFRVDGGTVAVRYAGQSADIRAVSMSFVESRNLCAALQAVGALPDDVVLTVGAQGILEAVTGASWPAARGLEVRVQTEGDLVHLIQLAPVTP